MSWTYSDLFAEADRQTRRDRNRRVIALVASGASIAEALVNADGRNMLTASVDADRPSTPGTDVSLDAETQLGWFELLARVVAQPATSGGTHS